MQLVHVLDMDWFRETATELKMDASGIAPPAKAA